VRLDWEFAQNPEPRCPVVLLLDTSQSMGGAPINDLYSALIAFQKDVAADAEAALRVEVAIVTFGGSVELLQDFVTVDEFEPRPFNAHGKTPLGEALEYGIDLIEKRKAKIRRNHVGYYRPWLFLFTDGAPTDGERWKSSARHIRQSCAENKFLFYALAGGDVGKDAMNIFKQIVPEGQPVYRTRDFNFSEAFKWVSASTRLMVTGAAPMPEPAPQSGTAEPPEPSSTKLDPLDFPDCFERY